MFENNYASVTIKKNRHTKKYIWNDFIGETSSCVPNINLQNRKNMLKFQHVLLRGER